MSIIALIPAAACTFALFFWTPGRVFRNIALPVVLLLPFYFYWKAAMLPPIDFCEGVLMPLGIAMAIRSMRTWRVSVMDLWLLLFVLSTCVGDRLSGFVTGSTFELFDNVCKVLIPYMAGKLLIEQEDARAATLKPMVLLMFAASIPAMYEWKGFDNLFRMAFKPFFPGLEIPWITQMRNGYGRIAGPYAQAELAGMTFLFGLILALYLAQYYDWGPRFRFAPGLHLRKLTLVAGMLLLALLMTQSRGPELGLLFAVPIALVGRARRVGRAALIAAAIVAVVGCVAYVSLQKYTTTAEPTTEDQSSAQYRAVLLENYLPVAEHSGAWGYGLAFHPVGKQTSIDNEYLFIWLTQGWVGLLSFLMLIGGTFYNLLYAALYNPQKLDRSFAFTLLGILVGLLVTAATVFLGDQPEVLFFLLIGWSQALRVRPVEHKYAAFQQVYT
jgi:O-antigen ligase